MAMFDGLPFFIAWQNWCRLTAIFCGVQIVAVDAVVSVTLILQLSETPRVHVPPCF